MKMKRGLGVAAALIAACLVLSCSEKKQSNVIIAPKPVKQAPKAPAKMDEFKHTDDVPWLDKTYKVEVHRFVADSLPKVKDEQGNPYFDNLIRVRVLRADGSEFFNRVFSKKSFNDYLMRTPGRQVLCWASCSIMPKATTSIWEPAWAHPTV